MAFNEAAGSISKARVNSTITKATDQSEFNFGQHGFRSETATVTEKPRPIPALSYPSTPPTGVKRKISIPYSAPVSKPPSSPSSPRRAVPSNIPAKSPSIYPSLNNLNRPSLSAPAYPSPTRSPTAASPSRIAQPRAVPTLPATGQASRARKNSSAGPSPGPTARSIDPSLRVVKVNPLTPSPRTAKPRPPTNAKSPTPVVSRVSTMGDRMETRSRLSSGKGLRSEQNAEELKPNSRSEQSARPTASEVSKNLGLLPGDVDVLKSLWEDSAIEDDAFDPGESESPADRSAVKSGYGSVFGFNLAPKSRSSVAITEVSSLDRSQSISSIASVLSSSSTKTISNSRAVSPFPSAQPVSRAVPHLAPTVPDSSNFSPKTGFTTKLPILESRSLAQPVVSTSELRPTKSTGASGSTSRVSLPASPRLRLKSAPIPPSNAMITPQAVPSSVPLAKDTSTQSASPLDIRARLPAPVVTPLHPSNSEMSHPHTHRTELPTSSIAAPASAFVNRKTPEWETNTLASASVDQNSSHPPPRPRYTSNNSSISANLSPSSPFGLSAAPGGHHYSPQNSPTAHPPTVNLKHLLSKPAPTGNSSASESESTPASKNSRPVRRIERIEEKNEKQRIEAVTRERANESDGEGPSIQRAFAGGSRERDRARKSEWEAERILLKERSSSNTGTTTPNNSPADTSQPKDSGGFGSRLVRSTSWSRSREREGTEKAEKKPRNVLKRRPSTANITPSPEVVDVREFPYSSFAPAYTGSILPVTPRRPTTSGNLKPPTPGHSSSRGSSPARDERRRSLIPQSAMLKQGIGGVGLDDAVSVSSGTTPAKEIMLAYKQQQEREKNREKERSERIREKQRERELWQREEEDRQRRALKDTPPTVPYNGDRALSASGAISSSKSIPSPVKSRPERSFSAPNTGTYSHSSTQIANIDSPLSPQSKTSPSRTPKSLSHPVSPAGEEPAQPYYTVFGDSRSVVPVQGVTMEESFLPDFSWSTSNLEEGLSSSIGTTLGLDQQPESPHVWERSASVTAGKPSSKSSTFGLGKTLSRKMSGRLGPSKKEPGVSSTPAMILQERGRQSLQERKDTATSPATATSPRRCLRLSIDEYGPSKSALSSTSPIPVLYRPREGDLRGSMTPVLKSTLPSSPQARPTSAAGLPSGSKSKIWNLMKRISTGGLRDNYRGYDVSAGSSPASPLPPPPVPALPKDLSVYPKGTRPKDDTELAYGDRVGNVTSTPAPTSTTRKNSSTTSSRIPVTRIHGPSETSTSTSTRAGTATRSSSPISSSDIGSSKFFNRSQSQRSSSSSYGEQVPPVPTAPAKVAMLQQHILPPSELYKLHLSLERNKEDPSSSNTSHTRSSLSINTTPSLSNSRSHPNLKLQVQRPKTASSAEEWMIVPTPKDERPSFSLPVPRRRGEGSVQRPPHPPLVISDNTRSPSPIIPMFSIEAVINTWSSGMSRKTKSSGSATPPSSSDPFNSSPRVSSPPAIPSKSPRRTASASASSNSTKLPSLPRLPLTPSVSPSGGNTKSDYESETTSRRASRKSMGSGISSDTQTGNYVRRRATSSSGKSTVRDLSSSTAISSRPPRPEPPRGARMPGALSDKQKADNLKWDNLLERSNKAGGTLHLNGGIGRLPSDRLAYDIEDDY